jgi:hypothetical protein
MREVPEAKERTTRKNLTEKECEAKQQEMGPVPPHVLTVIRGVHDSRLYIAQKAMHIDMSMNLPKRGALFYQVIRITLPRVDNITDVPTFKSAPLIVPGTLIEAC